jgi:hypothetical protein
VASAACDGIAVDVRVFVSDLDAAIVGSTSSDPIGGHVIAKFAAFYVREGFALGIVIGVVLAVFMPYEWHFKIVGFVFAVVVSLAACAVQFRRAGKRRDGAD